MVDLNLCVPNIASDKYTADEKFAQLRSYLFELNETLSYALSSLDSGNLSAALTGRIETGEKSAAVSKKLEKTVTERFSTLKSDIIRAADEVFSECSSELTRTDSEIKAYVAENYTAASVFGTYRAGTDSAISANTAGVQLNAARAEEISTELEGFKQQSEASLEIKADEIISGVEQSFALKDSVDELSETLASRITQTSQDITETFSQTVEGVREDLTTLGGEVNELVSSLDVYIRRGLLANGEYGIEIGRTDSGIKARFTNERISFCRGESEVAFISGTDLYITRAQVLDYLEIGNSSDGYFKFDVTGSGLEVRWLYGSEH